MATKLRIEFDSKAFREILMSQKVADVLKDTGQRIASTATASIPYEGSNGYYCNVTRGGYGGGRMVAFVGGLDFLADLAEANQKVLTKAVG